MPLKTLRVLMNAERIVKVAFPLGVNKEFDYRFQANLGFDIGSRVLVEFNRKKRVGIAVSFAEHSSVKNIKPVIKILDSSPCLNEGQLEFARRLANYYLYSWGEIIFMMVPHYLRRKQFVDIPPFTPSGIPQKEVIFIKNNTFIRRFASYRDEIMDTLKRNSVILCFPLVSHLEEFCREADKNLLKNAVVFHSYQSLRENFNNWLISRQSRKLILGTRIALFYYPHDLGLIVIEGENSPYYFQPEKPYYHLTDVARMLSDFKKTKIILSGDYPSLSVYKKYKEKQITLVEGGRIDRNIEVFDIKDIRLKKRSMFSPFVIELMRKNLQQDKKILIVWGKKNFSSVLRCEKCGFCYRCPRCTSYLKFSLNKQMGICSWCGFREQIDHICKSCGTGYIKPLGVGIERLENIVMSVFPEMDVRKIEEATPKTRIVLSTFKIINTLSKLPFEIEACYVFDIDNLLSRIDYESTVEAFLYVKRIAQLVKTHVYIFTQYPQHYLWENISKNWKSFYDAELDLREKLQFPPYGSMVKVTLRSKNKNTLIKKAQSLYNRLIEEDVRAFEPMEEIPFKLRDNYRYSVVAKSDNKQKLIESVDKVIVSYRRSSCKLAVVVR